MPRSDRRTFVRTLSLGALALAGSTPRRWLRPRFDAYPFSLGVASGDPVAHGFVLWTRLAPDPLRGGGMPPDDTTVGWEIAADESMRRIVKKGSAVAPAELAHSVHVEVDGLAPDRWYWYRFHVSGAVSPVGRARTMPPAGVMPDRLRFAFVSCQHYEQGYYTAYRHLAGEDVDLVAHLGDYIYEGGITPAATRHHTSPEVMTLEDYRNRYALYKCDPDLQAAHVERPWILTWDDHEVSNNYAGEFSATHDPVDRFLRRRAAAYQAYFEHQPLRFTARPHGPDARLYRTVDVGELARFYVLDTRQYRTDQPCGDRIQPVCAERDDPAATMMGSEQERWLFDRMTGSKARWQVIAQQVFMAKADHDPTEGEAYNMDSWNGYPAARQRLLDFVGERGGADTVVLTGDVHSSWAADLKRDWAESSPAVASELVGTSISSGGDGNEVFEGVDAVLAANPHIKFYNGKRGYVRCELNRDRWRTDWRMVPYVSRADAPISTVKSFVLERGRPGLMEA